MGFIINDTLTLPSGITVTGAYVMFGKETLSLSANSDETYRVSCVAHIYKDRRAALEGKQPIDNLVAEEIIREAQLNGNLFRRLFNLLKDRYHSTSDD